jgi:hypothetical protein
MHRAIAIAVAGASLAGCSSYSLDSFKPTPPSIQLQLESVPSGADALTSIGPGCKTPCSVAVNAPDAGFTVTFNMPKFQPVTVPVQVQRNPGDLLTADSPVINPNPVVAELKPAGPPPRAARKPMRPKKPKKPKGDAAPAPDAGTPFPAPAAAPAAAPPPPATQPAR